MNPPPETSAAAAAAPGGEEKLQRLRELLRQMFQMDRGDLDFGLYRIMNMKTREVEKFLNGELLPQVQSTLGAEESDPQAEADVYHHLADFFSRYYHEGDFLAQRRYRGGGQSAYLLPYGGEEVKMHWANADQYYIKTTENYAGYVFTVGENGGEDTASKRVRFEIAAANNEKDVIKAAKEKQRRFVLAAGAQAVAETGAAELTVRFEHRPLNAAENKRWPGTNSRQQSRINAASVRRVLEAAPAPWQSTLSAPRPTAANETRSLLALHLERYTAKNSFDYFIHKDLGGFLRQELELYLKQEVLQLDTAAAGDISQLQRAARRLRTIRFVAQKIIAFLAQLENFQKRLWLKKKFVLQSNWCVTLDRIPQKLYAQVCKNKAQHEEWLRLFAIAEIRGDLSNGNNGYGKKLTPAFLKANPYLVLDTRHFGPEFTDELLAALSEAAPLDEQCNGLLLHGENFQALNLLQARYRGQVKCVYIDPPYNTDASAILYKNGYKDSSWLSLMENRLALAQPLLGEKGILCAAIDDEEVSVLRHLLADIFAAELGVVSVRSNPAGRKTKGRFAPAHEYALFFGRTEETEPGSLEKTEDQQRAYPNEDAKGRYIWTNLIRSGTNDRREDGPKLFYPIYVGDGGEIRIPEMEWDDAKREWIALEEAAANETVVLPMRAQGENSYEGNWHRGHKRIVAEPDEYRVRQTNGDARIIQFKKRMDEEAKPTTWWGEGKYQSANGTVALRQILGERIFDFPKSVALVSDCLTASMNGETNVNVLDFFGGSGTTGHAVINLNRADEGRRKYILVEVGHHFEDVLLPRIKKVVYSADWKEGKPVSRQGVSQLFRVLRLESYEDTMDSLQMQPPPEQILNASPELAEDYMLRYALEEESAASACLLGAEFAAPFAYTISTVRDGIRMETPVDLPETFNLLLGLRVASRRRLGGVLAFTGADAAKRECLVLWRNLAETGNPALEKWFAKHRKKFAKNLHAVYVNGDCTLAPSKKSKEEWQAHAIEPLFKTLMFPEGDDDDDDTPDAE